jgi:hypothetical protein
VFEVDVEVGPPRQGRGEADQGFKGEQTLWSASEYPRKVSPPWPIAWRNMCSRRKKAEIEQVPTDFVVWS